MYDKKVGHFSSVQKEYICLCLALDMEIPEIVENFRMLFPEVGFWLAPKALKYKLARRISDIKRKNTDDIAVCRQKAKASTKYALQANPMAHAVVRLRKLQQMYDATPLRELVRMEKDLDGSEFPVYKNNAMELMKIAKTIFEGAQGIPFRYVRVDKNGKETEISAQEYSAASQEAERRRYALMLHLDEGGSIDDFEGDEVPTDVLLQIPLITLVS